MAGQGERIGRYVLDRLLGRGGMGEVWEASLHGLHGFRRRVALKIVTADAIDDESRNTLIAEARMGAMLHHPNICGTLELGHDGGHWFIAMELVEGATLRTLAKQGLLSPRAVIEAGIQTCRGLEHVHASGLVHRDIKESNLVVDRYGMVKIVDLGVARLRGAASGVGGTPGYMPAEQLLGREGAPADIFALGATLFRITSGRRPFGKRDDAIRAVLDMGRAIAGLDLSTSIEPFVPGLGAVVADCLAQEPEARPTAADLGDRLRRLLRGLKGRSLEDGVAAVRLEAQPSPPASSESRLRRGRFPRVPTAMIGRADVLDQVRRALAPGSVVTLAALGGMGKTRLSLAVAAGLDGELEGGSWFVDLSEVTALEGIRPALAGALGLKADEEGALDAVLATPRLLVLDNVEQLPGAGAEIIEGIAAAASTSPLLVTSRVPLGLERETVVRLEPLSGTASLELLTERNPELKRADEAVLDRIVGWLEGSPLAIELTAAQTRTVPVEEVERRLSRAFDAVEDESGEHPLRHQSLRATLDGSWALLQPTERSTLAQLTVFAGGFLPEAAIAVVDGPGVQDALAFLVDCSLLQIDRSGRLRMLPSTAAYAKEHLADPDALGARTRHVAWFAQLGHPDVLSSLERRGGYPRLERLAAELDNLFAAARTAAELGDLEREVAATLAASAVLHLRGPHQTAIDALETLAEKPLAPDARSRVFAMLARLGFFVGNAATGARHAALAVQAARLATGRSADVLADALLLVAEGLLTRNELTRARDSFREALTLAPRCDNPLVEARALEGLATIQHRRGRPEQARSLYKRAGHLYDERGAEHVRGAALVALATHLIEVGDLEPARQVLERAQKSAERTGHRKVWLRALGALALIDDLGGDLDAAAATYLRAIRESRAFGMRRTEASNLLNLGSVYVVQGETRKALEALEEARGVLARTGNPEDLDSIVLYWMGASAVDRGAFEEAARLLGTIRQRKKRTGEPRWDGAAAILLARVALQQGELPDAQALLLQAEPLVQAAEDPSLAVQWQVERAALAAAYGDPARARTLLREARANPAVEAQPWLLGRVALEQAAVELAARRPIDGLAYAARSREASERAGYRVQAACASALEARALQVAGRDPEAESARARAAEALATLRASGQARLQALLSGSRDR